MFDIGFWELAIIAVVGLIVIGPDKLPGVARTAGKWVGRTRRFVHQVKTDIDLEVRQDELRKLIEKNDGLNEIKQAFNAQQYSVEEEKDYLVSAIDDAKGEQHSTAQTEQSADELDNDSPGGHSDHDKTVKHERT